jgi:hypothetical protein
MILSKIQYGYLTAAMEAICSVKLKIPVLTEQSIQHKSEMA